MSASHRPSIFISHKAHDLDTEPVLQEICAILNSDFDIQIDVTGVEPGEEWQEKIETWLIDCHAAILLLSPAAIKSHWVQFETNFLCLRRRAMDHDLTILAVPLGEVMMHQLPSEFEKSRITEIQAISGLNRLTLAEALRTALRPVKEKYGVRSSLYELERDLIHVFDEIGDNFLRTEVILDAAESLGLERSAVARLREKSRWLARKLFATDLNRLDAVIRNLPEGMREKRGVMILQKVAPFCWVDPKAAARIPAVARKPESQRGAGINSDDFLTARMYVRRACARSKIWRYREVPAIWSDKAADDLIYYIRKLVMNMMGYRPDAEVDSEELRSALLDDMEEKGPVIVIVPLCKADPSLLAELMAVEEFKPLTFVVLLGNITAQQFENDRFTRIEYIQPELNHRTEREALRRIRQIDPRIDNYGLQ